MWAGSAHELQHTVQAHVVVGPHTPPLIMDRPTMPITSTAPLHAAAPHNTKLSALLMPHPQESAVCGL